MIKPVEYDGLKWRVTFVYTPNKIACAARGGPVHTCCVVYGSRSFSSVAHQFRGEATCAVGDRPSYEIGRKLALTRALAGAPKDFRRAIWQAYLGRKKQKRGDQ